jgi:hypothetical protein
LDINERGFSPVNLGSSGLLALDLINKKFKKIKSSCFNGVDCDCREISN